MKLLLYKWIEINSSLGVLPSSTLGTIFLPSKNTEQLFVRDLKVLIRAHDKSNYVFFCKFLFSFGVGPQIKLRIFPKFAKALIFRSKVFVENLTFTERFRIS
ncbi:hypothetical protein LEP1GSC019_1219 [Leptospira interrogans serovar Pyrogenes str. 2006006960]|nr:hypothetical protein LEP1GSC019_1219 [Leptospira interrogans serovar Pyrogenes str. 2006006960]